jgi:hypothetical protein
MDTVKPIAILLFVSACIDARSSAVRSSAVDLCGDPPVIRGTAVFATTVQDQNYFCFLDDGQLQLEADISLTRQWVQCVIEAR